MKRYPLKIAVAVYDEGDPRIIPALAEVKAFIEANSKFRIMWQVMDVGFSNPSPSTSQPPSYLLGPGSVIWGDLFAAVPLNTRILVLTWSCKDLPNCPAMGGGTWPVWSWWEDWPITLVSIAYKHSGEDDLWRPDKDSGTGILTGFSSGYVTTVVNELIQCLYFWIAEQERFALKWLYNMKEEDYPDRKAKYAAWYAQLTDPMYEAFVGPGGEENSGEIFLNQLKADLDLIFARVKSYIEG